MAKTVMKKLRITRRHFVGAAAAAAAGAYLGSGGGEKAEDTGVNRTINESVEEAIEDMRENPEIRKKYSEEKMRDLERKMKAYLTGLYTQSRKSITDAGVEVAKNAPKIKVTLPAQDEVKGAKIVRGVMELPADLIADLHKGYGKHLVNHEFMHDFELAVGRHPPHEGRTDWLARMVGGLHMTDGGLAANQNIGYPHSSLNWGLISYLIGYKKGRSVSDCVRAGTDRLRQITFTPEGIKTPESYRWDGFSKLGEDIVRVVGKERADDFAARFFKSPDRETLVPVQLMPHLQEKQGRKTTLQWMYPHQENHARTEAVFDLFDAAGINPAPVLQHLEKVGDLNLPPHRELSARVYAYKSRQ